LDETDQFGGESSLDGELLTSLAGAHNGLYTRAMSPLHLKKFFSLASGNIFEAGAAIDPEFFLPKETNSDVPLKFDVCGEDNVTVVVGWDVDVARLDVTSNEQLLDLGFVDSGFAAVADNRYPATELISISLC
jgi:hypothetical protein